VSTQPYELFLGDLRSPQRGLQHDEELLHAAARQDLNENAGNGRESERINRGVIVPVRSAAARRMCVRAAMATHPDVNGVRLVEHPEPEMSGGGDAREWAAVPGGGRHGFARALARVDAAPQTDQRAVVDSGFDRPARGLGAQSAIRHDGVGQSAHASSLSIPA